ERQDYRKLGSLAAEVSAKGIARRLSWRIQAGDRSRVLEAAGGSLDAITGQHVFDGARDGDGVAISVIRDTAKYIGMAVATLSTAIACRTPATAIAPQTRAASASISPTITSSRASSTCTCTGSRGPTRSTPAPRSRRWPSACRASA